MAKKKTEPGKRQINAELKKAKDYAKSSAMTFGIVVELWQSKDNPLEFAVNRRGRVTFLDEKYTLIAMYNEKGEDVT